MKDIRIKSIALNNWRGQTKEIILEGRNALVSGRNRSGKSSVLNAFLWCIFGTDEKDRSNYLLFDDRMEQTHDNAIPAEVEVKLIINGDETTLKRVAEQGWVRRRGTDVYERSGSDNYSFFWDGIERSARQFKSDVEEIFGAPEDKLKIMLNLSYFQSLDWKTQRKNLGDIIGEVKESDFKNDYSFMFEQLGRLSVDDIREKYKALLKPVKESTDKLPIEIAALEENLPTLEGLAEKREEVASLEQKVYDIDQRILDRSKELQPLVDKRAQELRVINEKTEALMSEKAEYEMATHMDPTIREAKRALEEAQAFNMNIGRYRAQNQVDIQNIKSRISVLEKRCTNCAEERERLHKKLEEVKSREFKGGVCHYCGQPLPEDKLEAAMKNFSEDNEAERIRIVSAGKNNNSLWDTYKRELEAANQKLSELESASYEVKDIKPLMDALKEVQAAREPFSASLAYKEKTDEIQSLKDNLTVIPVISNDDLLEEKKALSERINALRNDLGVEGVRKSMESQISKKREELKENAALVAKYEGLLFTIDQYEREKAAIIRTRVNRLFKVCDVQMETQDKSGRMVPTCIINDSEGVDFRVTNTASQFACRMDIASAFAGFYELRLPLIVDNTEMINRGSLPEFNGQTIELRVSEEPFDVELV